MSCYNCTKSFTLLNRERSCKKCGFAFCSNCLKQKLNLPGKNNNKIHSWVCPYFTFSQILDGQNNMLRQLVECQLIEQSIYSNNLTKDAFKVNFDEFIVDENYRLRN